MRKLSDIDIAEVVGLYINQHLTCAVIASRYGVSDQCIRRNLRKIGVSAHDGEHVQVKCTRCGKDFDMPRARWRKTSKRYCSQPCYMAALNNPAYRRSVWGTILARRAVSRVFSLKAYNVVHHIDSNDDNNELSNLWVFASQADHMRHHRGGKAQPIWRGDQVVR